MALKSPQLLAFGALLMLGALAGTCYGDLKGNYYKKTCPSAEYLVETITRARVVANPSLAAKLLRLNFHDCFVRGCDASILLESPTKQAEKDAFPNLSLGGFDVIDEIKAEIEKKCQQVVSCADIVTLAARDAVATLNPDAWWFEPTGRRDGNASILTDALSNLPPPFADFETLKSIFEGKGLNVVDLVALSGAHTIGITHCGAVVGRLYNFNGQQGKIDPSLDKNYAAFLKQLCPQGANPADELEMDPDSAGSFDSNYFSIVEQKKGIFQSDAALLNNTASRVLVNLMQNKVVFFKLFGYSMQKMNSIGVLTGTDGQIRKHCSFVN